MANLCRRGHLKKSSKHAVCTKCYAIDREKHHALARALLLAEAKKRADRIAAEEAAKQEKANAAAQTGEG